jgi:hypothetical protein
MPVVASVSVTESMLIVEPKGERESIIIEKEVIVMNRLENG